MMRFPFRSFVGVWHSNFRFKRYSSNAGVTPDARSGLAESGKVFKDETGSWSAMLNQTDIARNWNKFYLLQLIESPSGFTTFTCWGRVGEAGAHEKFEYPSLEEAKELFMKKFKEKTGNKWLQRSNFVIKPNKYALIELSVGEEKEDKVQLLEQKNESKLDPRVQDLIQMISDIDTMQNTMKEYKIDTKKMPLGKLSKNHIKTGYEYLKQLQEAIESNSEPIMMDLSSQFYRVIPHNFGRSPPPIINNKETLKQKMEMLETLTELEFASGLLKETSESGILHPIDATYSKLNTDIIALDSNDPEYEFCKRYMQTNHAPSHSNYHLNLEQVFKVKRRGEEDRFAPTRSYGNRRLLWHGTRTTNMTGILCNGLKIAPPEAPSTGYMFGKGIYFADFVSKSANYCHANSHNSNACLLLCDVALGGMYRLTNGQYVTTLPNGKQSTKGLGTTIPDPSMHMQLPTDPNVMVPLGKPISSASIRNSSLYYNEYIVYNVEQVNIKYLLKVKFCYH